MHTFRIENKSINSFIMSGDTKRKCCETFPLYLVLLTYVLVRSKHRVMENNTRIISYYTTLLKN